MNAIERPRLIPADTPDYMIPAWASALNVAVNDKRIFNLWITERNIDVTAAISKPLTRDLVDNFVLWFNETIWGPALLESDDGKDT